MGENKSTDVRVKNVKNSGAVVERPVITLGEMVNRRGPALP